MSAVVLLGFAPGSTYNTMNDTTRLIEQLRLDRDAPVTVVRRGRLAAAALMLTGVVLAAAWLWSAAQRQEIAPAPVQASEVGIPAAVANGAVDEDPVLNASGYIVARRQATVSAKVTARVRQVLIEEGQRVEEGEVIALLDDTNASANHAHQRAQLEQARAQQRAAELALANEAPMFQRAHKQLERGISSQQDFDIVRAGYDAARSSVEVAQQAVAVAETALAIAARNLDDTIVRAPFTGIVTGKAAQPGEMISPVSAGGGFTRTGIGTIVDMESLEVEVDVSESFIHRIVAGQPVSVRLNAYPDWALDARVIAIVPAADRAKATVKVRIALQQFDPRILPDMGVRVAFLQARESIHTDPATED